MKFKKLVSIGLCIAMLLCNVLVNFAADNLNGEETTTAINNIASSEIIVESTTASIEDEEKNIATKSEIDEDENSSTDYEEEKESDDEETESSSNIESSSEDKEESDEEAESCSEEESESSNEEESYDDTFIIGTTDDEIESSEIDNNDTNTTETNSIIETIVTESTIIESENAVTINTLDESANKVASPSEIDDEIIESTDFVLISTKSEALKSFDAIYTTLATISEISQVKIATKSVAKKGEIKNFGYISSNYKAPIAKRNLNGIDKLFRDTAIPNAYDSRDHQNASGLSIIPPVRDQGNYGTCWAFSTIGLFEASLRSKNMVSNENDSNLSEAALAYFTLDLKDVTNSKNNIDYPGIEGRDYSEVNVEYFKSMGLDFMANFAQCGGNQLEPLLMASTYMGVVKENEDTAYSQISNIVDNGLDGKYAFNNNDFEIKNAQFINKNDKDLIKQAIMTNGAVAANYCEARNQYNCHKFGDDYYYFSDWWTENSANHAIVIVGWDDTIPKEYFYAEDPYDDDIDDARQATHNGGWLIRNSWGAINDLMNAGYFWISYDDISLENTFYSVEAIPKDTYKYNYHHDTSGNDHDGVLSGVPLANVFQVSNNEDQILKAVNMALNNSSDAIIEIYTSNTKMTSPIQGKKVLTQAFAKPTGGVWTIDLDKDILLKSGSYFSIVINPTGEGIPMFIDNLLIYEASPKTHYNEVKLGQSFYQSNNGNEWIDLNASDTRTIDNITYGQNYRIRALTNPTSINITFNANGGKGKMAKQGVLSAGTVTLDKNKFTRDKYVFSGWKDAENNFYNDGDKINLSGNITLYAQWEDAYTITYVGNGGKYNNSDEYEQYVKKDSAVKLDSCKFTKGGYSFNNWKDEKGKSYSNEENIGIISGDITLTAQWTKNVEPVYPSGGNNGGGGGGGSGNLMSLDQLQMLKPNETTINMNLEIVPINYNTAISAWTATDDGKWHLNIVNALGVVEEVKNQFACVSRVIDLNGSPMTVQDIYYFDEKGDMLTGWLTDATGKKYFLDINASELGKLAIGWKKIADKYYFFNGKGVLVTSGTTPDGYEVDSSGAWLS